MEALIISYDNTSINFYFEQREDALAFFNKYNDLFGDIEQTFVFDPRYCRDVEMFYVHVARCNTSKKILD